MRYFWIILLFASVGFAQEALKPPKGIIQMPSDLLGEPLRLEQMRIGDEYWLPADCLFVDSMAQCWLDPSQPIKFPRKDHLIFVKHFKNEHTIGYHVLIEAKRLQGWRWKLGTSTSTQMMNRNFIPVVSLSYVR